MKTWIKNFITCGLVGWCAEILFTALNSLQRRDYRLTGSTSIWMFPIYGLGCLIRPFARLLEHKKPIVRGLCYAAGIFAVEYLTGRMLWRRDSCPWDYGRSRWNIGRVIRLDFLPCWVGMGLLMERILSKKK